MTEKVCIYNKCQVLKVLKTNNLEEAMRFIFRNDYEFFKDSKARYEFEPCELGGFTFREGGVCFFSKEQIAELGFKVVDDKLIEIDWGEVDKDKAPFQVNVNGMRSFVYGFGENNKLSFDYVVYDNKSYFSCFLMTKGEYADMVKEIEVDNLDDVKKDNYGMISLNDYNVSKK